MAGKGEVYRRHDGKWAWRIKASNSQIVATDGGQGYDNRAGARKTLEKVMVGDYAGRIDDLD
jgi:uncharacterized protein YegP (UPF0339 family)